MNLENSKTWDKSFCDKVIETFCNDDVMENYFSHNRKYKRYILHQQQYDELSKQMFLLEHQKVCWVWESVDKLIKANLGENHYLTTWLIGLRYDKGDYFLEHKDGYGQGERYLSGGIELSTIDKHEGGIYTIEGEAKRNKEGVLFVHSPLASREITKVTKGTRYSLHFCISKEPSTLI